MEKTKVILLGTGFIANIHMESYNRFVPDAQIVAVYGRNPEKAGHLQRPTAFLRPTATWTRCWRRRKPRWWISAFPIIFTMRPA